MQKLQGYLWDVCIQKKKKKAVDLSACPEDFLKNI